MNPSARLLWVTAACLAPVLLAAQEAAERSPLEDLMSRVAHTLHVNPSSPQAADAGSGSEEQPLRTITRAVQLAAKSNEEGAGTRILIYPGVYRERIRLRPAAGKGTDAPIVLEATESRKAVISGSEVWSGWTRQGDTDLYVHDWPFKWGSAKAPAPLEGLAARHPVLLRREMLFANGSLVRQAVALGELGPSSFRISEEEGQVRVRLPGGGSPEESTVEVAERSRLFHASGTSNVILSGLVFQHDSSPLQGFAVSFSDCKGVLIQDCSFRWNNWGGVALLQCREVVVRGSVFDHNGGAGLSGWRTRDLALEKNLVSHSNWRGASAGLYSWLVAGVRLVAAHGVQIVGHRSVRNQCRGLWLDTGCREVRVENGYWAEDQTGIFVEGSPGPVTIKDCTLAENRGAGVVVMDSQDLVAERNTLYGNRGAQILFAGPGGRQLTDWESGEELKLSVQRCKLLSNEIVSSLDHVPVISVGAEATRGLVTTLTSARNLWYHPQPERSFHVAGMALGFQQWQEATQADVDSVFADPLFVNPQRHVFRPRPDSPIPGRDSWPELEPAPGGMALLERLKREEITKNWSDAYAATEGTKEDEWRMLDLAEVANRPLRGEGGGWIGIPLDHFDPGEKRIHGVPFRVIDESGNDGAAAVALRSSKFAESGGKPYLAEVVIHLGARVKAIYVLHGCAWARTRTRCARYEFAYEDGTSTGVDIVPYGAPGEAPMPAHLRARSPNIQDWWPTFQQFEDADARKVIIADPEDPLGYQRYLYSLQWTNPHPEKVLDSIVLKSEPQKPTTVLVLAVTALKAEGK